MRNRSLDLLSAVGLAVAAGAAVWWGAPVAVSSVLGVLLVLLAPGYVWADVFFGSRLSAEPRAAVSVSLSLAVTAVGGVLLYSGGVRLDRVSWVTLLATTTLVGGAVAAILRSRVRSTAPAGAPLRRPVARMSPTQAMRLAVAGLLGAAGLGIAIHSANAQVQPAFTALSLNQHGSAPGTAEVVLGNHEKRAQLYRLVASTDGVVSKVWMVTVADGASWQSSLPARPGQRLSVNMYRTASGGPPYRHVSMSFPPAGAK